MVTEKAHQDKTAHHLDRLSQALDSSTRYRVGKRLKNGSTTEIGDLLESLPSVERQTFRQMTDPDVAGKFAFNGLATYFLPGNA